MTPDAATDAAGSNSRFTTTRWSLILSSLDGQSDEVRAREALAQLCRIYWRPIFAFVCRKGHTEPDAQDLTQDFFVMVLKGNFLQQANPERGRFRSLLLKSLQNFLIDAHSKSHARKRGGAVQFVSWDEWMAEAFHNSPGCSDETVHIFLATGLEAVADDRQGAEEQHMQVARLPLADALALVEDGGITDSKTVIGLLLVSRPE